MIQGIQVSIFYLLCQGMSKRPSLRQSIRPTPTQSTVTRPSMRQSMSTGPSTSKRQSLFKRKDKLENEAVKDSDKLRDADLGKYCPQKIFNVMLVNETDEQSNKIMNTVIEISREFEEISFLTFITYDEVVSLIENCDKVVLPAPIQLKLKDISKTLKGTVKEGSVIPPKMLAKLMKIKLIEVMYMQYIKAVTKMQSRKKLIAELKALIAECSAGKDKSYKRAESAMNLKRAGSQTTFDFTSIPIDSQDDIIFDDDINHFISFYIFHGFYDPEILRELIVTNGVDIQSILKVASQSSEKTTDNFSTFCDFWEQIPDFFEGPRRCAFLENTFLMTHTPTGNDFKQIFEELLYVIRSVTDIKLHHLNYVKHMEILPSKEIYHSFPLECFTVYNNFFQRFPMELVNVPIILSNLLKQVTVSVDETFHVLDSPSQHSYLDANTIEQNRCTDPCSIRSFFKHRIKMESKPSSSWKPTISFLTYENDELFITLKSYKKYGPMVCDLTTNMLKIVHPISGLKEVEPDHKEIIHKHDIDPSTKTVLQNKDIVSHFLYLFLFNLFGHKESLPKSVETDLTKNLETYNKLEFVRHSQTQPLPYVKEEIDQVVESNLYNSAPIEYFWKEELGSKMLLQQIFKAESEYLYCDQRFSPETDTLLIQFSNCLDEFGINTKIYDQSLPIAVCLRDFCKYTTVEEPEWLEKNKLPKYVRNCFVREECRGVKKVMDQRLFPEYNYLIQRETETDQRPVTINENEISFEQLMEEIKRCPPTQKDMREYMRSERPNKFFVYDFGTGYFQIKGAKTTFHSHDDVKLTVENTTLWDEYPKCSVCLDCRGNSVILHHGKFYANEDYNFHINLADGTIVTFIYMKPRKSSKYRDSVLFDKNYSETPQILTLESDYEKYETTVLSVDQNYFDSNIETNLLNEEYSSYTEIAFKPSESMLDRLDKAATSNVPIYKVNNNLTHVKRLKSEFEIPLVTVVRRVLHNTVQKEEGEAFTKRYLSIKSHRQRSDPAWAFDARIALPNGLYVSFYPSKLKKGLMEVKQEFLGRNEATELEEFRLFARGGYVLIKKIDGSITILKANGDAIDHEKLDTDARNVRKWRTKPCHCKSVDDYRKRICKLFKGQGDEVPEVTVSRRAGFNTRKGYVVSPQTTDMLKNNNVPYLKSSVFKFDGTRICLESDKMRVKKVLHVTCENNFTKREVYYERSDGFRSTIDRLGRQLIKFVDGTTIRSTMHVAKELVDGYVYISLEFEYQHPNYATVAYRSDGALEVVLNNVVIRREAEDMVLKIDEDITTSVNTERLLFEKTCSKCKAKYTCDINIQPLRSGGLTPDKFLHACDSYDKHFYADLSGQCTRNQDYIKGAINALGCNHYSKMCYKELFVVNRDLSGSTFWTDNMVLAKKEATNQDENCALDGYKDVDNAKIQVYKFKRTVYDQYNHRFMTKSLNDDSKELVYSTFCVVKRMVDAKAVESFCQDLTSYFRQTENFDVKYCNTLEKMFEEKESLCRREKEILMKVKLMEEKKDKCKCIKEKIGFRDKIEKWRSECEKYRALIRRHELPCYFNSPFCKVIKH